MTSLNKDCKCENGTGKFAEIVSTANCPIHNNISLNKDEGFIEDIIKELYNKDSYRYRPIPNQGDGLENVRIALLKVRNATEKEVVNKLSPFIEHDKRCIVSDFEAGEPTPDGGYREKVRGKWYQSRPINETPKCDCGLNELLASLSPQSEEGFYSKSPIPTKEELDQENREFNSKIDAQSEEKIEIVPSPRIDYCCKCESEHGYDCPLDKSEETK